MFRIWLFIALLGSFSFSTLAWNPQPQNTFTFTNNGQGSAEFTVSETSTVFCPNQSICANPSSIAWNIALGGVPEANCNERCHLLFFVQFGSHTPGSAPASYNASSYTSTRDLYRFFDMLNNYSPYLLGYEFSWPGVGGFSVAGGVGFQSVDLTNATIDDIMLTINSFTVTSSTVGGTTTLTLTYSLTFSIIGNLSPSLTYITALPTGDSFIRNGTFSTENYGSLDYLLVSENFSEPSATRYSYFEFDLFYWTAITKATLRLWGSALDNANVAAIAYSVNGTFSESSITWANAPPIWLTASLFPTEINSTVQWYDFDITPLVREEYPHGNGTIYFAVVSYYGGAMRFSSREGNYPPKLEIHAVLPEGEQQALPPLFSIVTPPPSTTPATTTPSSTTPTTAPVTPPVTEPVAPPTSNETEPVAPPAGNETEPIAPPAGNETVPVTPPVGNETVPVTAPATTTPTSTTPSTTTPPSTTPTTTTPTTTTPTTTAPTSTTPATSPPTMPAGTSSQTLEPTVSAASGMAKSVVTVVFVALGTYLL